MKITIELSDEELQRVNEACDVVDNAIECGNDRTPETAYRRVAELGMAAALSEEGFVQVPIMGTADCTW